MNQRKSGTALLPLPPRTPRKLILIAMTADEGYRRTVLEGIAEFGEQGVDWEFFIDRPQMPAFTSARLHFDGVIADPASWARITVPADMPAVTVTGDPVPDGPPAVLADNVEVGRLGAQHLADAGLRQLAFVPMPRMRYSDMRWAGFKEVADRLRLPCQQYEPPDPSPAYGEPEPHLLDWLRSLATPIGILAVHDQRAEELMHACHSLGLRIPEDVAVLGVNNEFPTCRLTLPPLSSVDHGIRRMGYAAAALLHDLMSGKAPPKGNVVVVAPDRVVTRRSTDLLAVANIDVAAALGFIRDSADEPIKVRDVLKRVAVSRRTLENGFRAAVGRTIQGEITRVRIDRAKHLLSHTDASMPEIADACGIPYASQLSYLFNRECGMSPTEFRRTHRVPPSRRRA